MYLLGLWFNGKMTTHEVPHRPWQEKQNRKSMNKKKPPLSSQNPAFPLNKNDKEIILYL